MSGDTEITRLQLSHSLVPLLNEITVIFWFFASVVRFIRASLCVTKILATNHGLSSCNFIQMFTRMKESLRLILNKNIQAFFGSIAVYSSLKARRTKSFSILGLFVLRTQYIFSVQVNPFDVQIKIFDVPKISANTVKSYRKYPSIIIPGVN